jgi:hypothetical protein
MFAKGGPGMGVGEGEGDGDVTGLGGNGDGAGDAAAPVGASNANSNACAINSPNLLDTCNGVRRGAPARRHSKEYQSIALTMCSACVLRLIHWDVDVNSVPLRPSDHAADCGQDHENDRKRSSTIS